MKLRRPSTTRARHVSHSEPDVFSRALCAGLVWPAWDSTRASISLANEPPRLRASAEAAPEEHRRAFTDEQLQALALASIPPPPNHGIEYRVSLPFFGKRFYVTLFVGRERRARSRLVAEGQLPVSQIVKPDPVAWTLILALTSFGALLALFIAKAMFGVELGESVALPDVMQHLTDIDLKPN